MKDWRNKWSRRRRIRSDHPASRNCLRITIFDRIRKYRWLLTTRCSGPRRSSRNNSHHLCTMTSWSGSQWIAKTWLSCTRWTSSSVDRCISGISSNLSCTVIRCNDICFLILLSKWSKRWNHFIRETAKIPTAATPAPMANAVLLFRQKFLPYWIACLVSAFIYLAACCKSILYFIQYSTWSRPPWVH